MFRLEDAADALMCYRLPAFPLKHRRLGTLLKNGVGLEEEFLSTIIYEIFWVSMFISFRGCIV